jgi:hypothetical protein
MNTFADREQRHRHDDGLELRQVINEQINAHAKDCSEQMTKIYVTWAKAIGIMAAIAAGAAGVTWIVTSQIGDLRGDIKLIQYQTSYTATKIDTAIIKANNK